MVLLPNITNVFYGRDVGYAVERIVLDEETEAISATKIRSLNTTPGSRRLYLCGAHCSSSGVVVTVMWRR